MKRISLLMPILLGMIFTSCTSLYSLYIGEKYSPDVVVKEIEFPNGKKVSKAYVFNNAVTAFSWYQGAITREDPEFYKRAKAEMKKMVLV